MTVPFRAFTSRAPGRANMLLSQCSACASFDPATTPPAQHHAYLPFRALWDTGASASVITQAVVNACSLKPISMKEVHHAAGKDDAFTFLVNIGLPNGVNFSGLEVTLGKLHPNLDILIGMDIIGSGDFAVTNSNGKTVFSFRYPSGTEIDFTAGQPLAGGRNRPCHCGSGKKLKHCHGV